MKETPQLKPFFLNNNAEKLMELKNSSSVQVIDLLSLQQEELLEISYPNPEEREKNRSSFFESFKEKSKSTWIYLPWKEYLIHILNEEDFHTIRTNRNRELLNLGELKKIKEFRVGIAGLSIGSNLAYVLSHLGIREFKLADFDELSTSNLNRVKATLADLGKNKAELTAQNILETDPFSDVEVVTEGINKQNLENFLDGGKKLNVVIDSLDDIEMKIRLRHKSKELGIPVLMFSNLGDSTMIDIERYDKEPGLAMFNNLLGEIPDEILKTEITDENKNKFVAKLVGIENIPTKALESLSQMGKTLVGRPQLASTVGTSASLGAFLIKQIATNKKCPSGRYLVHYQSAIFENSTKDPYSEEENRTEILSKLMKPNG